MYNIFLFGALLVLGFVCVLVILFVLMQRPNANAGMGSALGGATTESVFGGESASVLSKATTIFIVLFFLLCAGLYLGFVHRGNGKSEAENLKIETQSESSETSLITTDASAGTVEKTSAGTPEPSSEADSGTTGN